MQVQEPVPLIRLNGQAVHVTKPDTPPPLNVPAGQSTQLVEEESYRCPEPHVSGLLYTAVAPRGQCAPLAEQPVAEQDVRPELDWNWPAGHGVQVPEAMELEKRPAGHGKHLQLLAGEY